MILDTATATKYSDAAVEDLRGYFGFVTKSESFAQMKDEVLVEVRAIEPNFAPGDSAVDFLKAIVDWLERTGRWPIKNGKTKQPGDLVKVEFFLAWIIKWLGSMTLSRKVPITGAPLDIIRMAPRIQEFGEYICWRPSSAYPTDSIKIPPQDMRFDAKRTDQDLAGFVSWLILDRKTQFLHVIYDDNAINGSSPDVAVQEARYEKVFLHEIGHARSELPFYYASGPQAMSRPRDESEAWIYADSFLSCLKSLRSRLCRILSQPDSEWL